jgi:hypothetical protein
MNRRTIRRFTAGLILSAATGVVWLLACGPFLVDLKTLPTTRPADLERYGRGEIGIVRPRFERRFLVQAYRRTTGGTALPATTKSAEALAGGAASEPSDALWSRLRAAVSAQPPPPAGIPTSRGLPDYQSFENCLDDAFLKAVDTLRARTARFGAESSELGEWVRAQDAVFANCGGKDLVLPEPASATADALTRADRAYQTAAAYFYGMRYEEAEKRFRAIAADPASPWRIYGHYLAARSVIRAATIPNAPAAAAAFANAQEDLRRVVADATARPLHDSAHGLLDLIETRTRPLERTRALANLLARSNEVSDRQLLDYQWLLDRLLGETPTGSVAAVGADELAKVDDLTTWIVTMQGKDEAAFERALGEWRRQPSVPWLIAVLWKMPPRHAAMPAALHAAAVLPAESPAAATVTVLRVRLLARSGDVAGARAVLAAAPRRVAPGFPPDAINLLDAERFMVAATFDELLRSAPRMEVLPEGDPNGKLKPLTPVFDDDAGLVFSERLPLVRLIEAARSAVLPARLRLRIAGAALTRTIVLRRHEQALKLLPVLRALAPALARDLDGFERATDPAARHRAGILLLLRTPGLHAEVRGLEDDWWFMRGEAARTFEHTFRRNWWCSADAATGVYRTEQSDLVSLLHGSPHVPFPSFITAAERGTVERERTAFAAVGTAPNYLATEAVAWARERPQDPNAAEALALAVEGTRWGCNDPQTSTQSRRAFQTLHRLFPKTEWARRTKYWY